MTAANSIDPAKLTLLLNELRLPAIKQMWPQFAERADKEGCRRQGSWPRWPSMMPHSEELIVWRLRLRLIPRTRIPAPGVQRAR